MKIQIDTATKVLKIEQTVNLKELFDFVKGLFPNNWQEYKLEVGTIIKWESIPKPDYKDYYERIKKPMLGQQFDITCGLPATTKSTTLDVYDFKQRITL